MIAQMRAGARAITAGLLVLTMMTACGTEGTKQAGVIVRLDDKQLCLGAPGSSAGGPSDCYVLTNKSVVPSGVKVGDQVEVRARLNDGERELLSIKPLPSP
jgi:hypothetical protein